MIDFSVHKINGQRVFCERHRSGFIFDLSGSYDLHSPKHAYSADMESFKLVMYFPWAWPHFVVGCMEYYFSHFLPAKCDACKAAITLRPNVGGLKCHDRLPSDPRRTKCRYERQILLRAILRTVNCCASARRTTHCRRPLDSAAVKPTTVGLICVPTAEEIIELITLWLSRAFQSDRALCCTRDGVCAGRNESELFIETIRHACKAEDDFNRI